MDLEKQLNNKQLEAALHTEGPLLILAGAGSGKTRVLTYRIANLIQKGIKPFNILAITFTNKASKEMKNRVDNLLTESNQILISTFHSFCIRILKREIENIGYNKNFSIYDTDDTNKTIRACLKEIMLTEKNFPINIIRTCISNFKNNMIKPDEAINESCDYKEKKIAQIYNLYEKKLKLSNALDFDDLIFKTVELFETNKTILEKYQNRFKYILVDEYQDTNKLQFKLIDNLASKYKNICVVGDDDQSIYGFRGADINNILDFEKTFFGAKIIKLEQNYRSSSNILDAANIVIKNNIYRKNKVLWTDNGYGNEINIVKTDTDQKEGLFVAEKINNLIKEGFSYKDIAILYRTNEQSRILEDCLFKNKIPFKIFGGIRFYDRAEIKNLMAYLKLINNPNDNIALGRIINLPKRGIGNTSFTRISAYAKANEISIFNALDRVDDINGINTRLKALLEFKKIIDNLILKSKTLTVKEVLLLTIEEINYIEHLETTDLETTETKIENVSELINKTVEFEENNDEPTLQNFLEEISLISDIDAYEEDNNHINLMTIHSAKGLEFPCVFVIGLEDGIFPSCRTFLSTDPKQIEEERRLFYVAITRAEKELFLTYATSRLEYGNIVYNSKSRFLNEILKDLQSKFIDKKTGKPIMDLELLRPKNVILDFDIGDKVYHQTHGIATVLDIVPAGADYEITLQFQKIEPKKYMSKLANLKKYDTGI